MATVLNPVQSNQRLKPDFFRRNNAIINFSALFRTLKYYWPEVFSTSSVVFSLYISIFKENLGIVLSASIAVLFGLFVFLALKAAQHECRELKLEFTNSAERYWLIICGAAGFALFAYLYIVNTGDYFGYTLSFSELLRGEIQREELAVLALLFMKLAIFIKIGIVLSRLIYKRFSHSIERRNNGHATR